MNFSIPTLLQFNWVSGSIAILLLLSALLSRLQDVRICTWIGILASVAAVGEILRDFANHQSTLLRVGFAYFAASWCAYLLWNFRIVPKFHPAVGIDPFAGPLSIMASLNLILGLSIWLSGIWGKRKGGFIEGFIQQRVFWILGAAMIFTSSHFFKLVSGV